MKKMISILIALLSTTLWAGEDAWVKLNFLPPFPANYTLEALPQGPTVLISGEKSVSSHLSAILDLAFSQNGTSPLIRGGLGLRLYSDVRGKGFFVGVYPVKDLILISFNPQFLSEQAFTRWDANVEFGGEGFLVESLGLGWGAYLGFDWKEIPRTELMAIPSLGLFLSLTF